MGHLAITRCIGYPDMHLGYKYKKNSKYNDKKAPRWMRKLKSFI